MRIPQEDRPRERAWRLGVQALSDAELLALLLRTGQPGRAVTLLAQDVLETYGGLLGVAQCSLHELADKTGVGRVKAITLAAVFELGRRILEREQQEGFAIHNAADVAAYMRPRLRLLQHEEFHVLLLDTKHRVVAGSCVSQGTLNTAPAHPREVFRDAVRRAAAAVVLVHNHPSGDPSPSVDDQRTTRRLVEAGRILGIDVLDHVILGDPTYYSCREHDPW